MRCKACDTILKSNEGRFNPSLGVYEELCRRCLRLSRLEDEPDEKREVADLIVPIVVPEEFN